MNHVPMFAVVLWTFGSVFGLLSWVWILADIGRRR